VVRYWKEKRLHPRDGKQQHEALESRGEKRKKEMRSSKGKEGKMLDPARRGPVVTIDETSGTDEKPG